jgi:hypothetical protein
MHLNRFGKADRLPRQPFNSSPQGQMVRSICGIADAIAAPRHIDNLLFDLG